MTTEGQGSGGLVPIYAVPSSSESAVLRLVATTDDGATAAYRAEAPGMTVLMTSGLCFHTGTGVETQRSCPVLLIAVSAGTSTATP